MRHFFGTQNNTALTQHLLHSRPIAVHRHVLQIAGLPAAGVLLSQLVYWTRRGVDIKAQHGWIHKSADQWERETGMSWKVQKRARQHLIEQSLIEERQVGVPRRLEFRLNLNEFAERTSQLIQIRLAEDLSLDLFRSDDIVIKQLLGQPISYHRVLARVTSHVNDAFLLSRLIHDQRQINRWQIRSRSDWLRELCMSRDQWETARRHLRTMGVLIERQSNFPRRVNLMIDQAALVNCLERHSKGLYTVLNPKSRQGVRVQTGIANLTQPVDSNTVGGFGRFRTAEIPTSESPKPAYPKSAHPKPAHKSTPKPPVQISQTPPYIEEGLQRGVQQQLHGANGYQIAEQERSGVVVASDQAKDLGLTRPGPVDRPNPLTVLNERGPLDPDSLVWADWLTQEQKTSAWWYLSAMPHETSQTVLDEVAFSHKRKTVHNPVGLIRYLVGLVKTGQFVAEGASTVANERVISARQQAQEQALQRAVQQAQAVPAPTASAQGIETVRAKLKAQAEQMKKGLTGRPSFKGVDS